MQRVLRIVMVAGLAVYIVSWALGFFGRYPTERVAVLSIGVAAVAIALEMFGQALFPQWNRDWWKPPQGKPATLRCGQLSTLGASIFFGALGLTFISYDELPELLGGVAMVAGIIGFGLMCVGKSLDKRRAESNKLNEKSLPIKESQQKRPGRVDGVIEEERVKKEGGGS